MTSTNIWRYITSILDYVLGQWTEKRWGFDIHFAL